MSPATWQWIATAALGLAMFLVRAAYARQERDLMIVRKDIAALQLKFASEVVTKVDCQSCKGGFSDAVNRLREEATERDQERRKRDRALFKSIHKIELAVAREFPNADIGGE